MGQYCTSDGHMGNSTAFGWQFRGHVVVQAALRDVVAKHGLGSGQAGQKDTLIFGGGSAVARGAMVHLDYVSEMLGSAAEHVKVVGFLDSPAWIDLPAYDSNFPGFASIANSVQSFANVQHLGKECVAKYPGESLKWKCMFGEYRLPMIDTKYFLVASSADSYQLHSSIGHTPSTKNETDYALLFANRTEDLLSELRGTKPDNGVFSWSCYNHCTSATSSGFQMLTAAGVTMTDAFNSWMKSASVPSNSSYWVDTCTGFACGTGCSSTAFQRNSENSKVYYQTSGPLV